MSYYDETPESLIIPVLVIVIVVWATVSLYKKGSKKHTDAKRDTAVVEVVSDADKGVVKKTILVIEGDCKVSTSGGLGDR